ncbi:MAG: hypothetical protein SFY69_11370 [Planctomycetota bacterium]|nr:hypothetical protein [Planctomycetota bacterium]
MINRTPRALSIAGLPRTPGHPWSGGTRDALAWAASLAYRSVHLDAASPDTRARDLSRSARRDLAAVLRRLSLLPAGLDLWIPPEHFASGAHVQRACEAVTDAIDLASELGALAGTPPPVVCIQVSPGATADVARSLGMAAERRGVRLADHAWPARPDASLAIGIDPASMLGAGADPVQGVTTLAGTPATARLSDLSAAGRVPAGDGRLDVLLYEGALSARSFEGPLVVDVRHLREPAAAAQTLSAP